MTYLAGRGGEVQHQSHTLPRFDTGFLYGLFGRLISCRHHEESGACCEQRVRQDVAGAVSRRGQGYKTKYVSTADLSFLRHRSLTRQRGICRPLLICTLHRRSDMRSTSGGGAISAHDERQPEQRRYVEVSCDLASTRPAAPPGSLPASSQDLV